MRNSKYRLDFRLKLYLAVILAVMVCPLPPTPQKLAKILSCFSVCDSIACKAGWWRWSIAGNLENLPISLKNFNSAEQWWYMSLILALRCAGA